MQALELKMVKSLKFEEKDLCCPKSLFMKILNEVKKNHKHI